jgi:hypothetical protein
VNWVLTGALLALLTILFTLAYVTGARRAAERMLEQTRRERGDATRRR